LKAGEFNTTRADESIRGTHLSRCPSQKSIPYNYWGGNTIFTGHSVLYVPTGATFGVGSKNCAAPPFFIDIDLFY
jgi:hypothetical protein